MKEFDNKICDKERPNSSRGIQLIAWLKHQLVEAHKNADNSKQPSSHYDGLRIARMDLLFDNSRMIDMLNKRGKAVKMKDTK